MIALVGVFTSTIAQDNLVPNSDFSTLTKKVKEKGEYFDSGLNKIKKDLIVQPFLRTNFG